MVVGRAQLVDIAAHDVQSADLVGRSQQIQEADAAGFRGSGAGKDRRVQHVQIQGKVNGLFLQGRHGFLQALKVKSAGEHVLPSPQKFFPVTGPEVITCPTCGRTQYPCTEIANEVEKRLQGYKKSIKVAVMGCVVNGPGEAREADIGIAGGKGEAVLFIHGQPIKKLTGDNILDQFMDEIYKL